MKTNLTLAGKFSSQFLWQLLTQNIRINEIGMKNCRLAILGVGCIEASPLEAVRASVEIVYSHWRAIDVKDSIVVDVGAFIGDSALLFVSKGAKRIYAFEPSPRFFRLACHNLRRHKNVIVENIGIGGWNRTTKLSGNLMGKHLSETGDETAYIVSAKEVIERVVKKEGKIDLLKIDCEGFEFEIFESLAADDLYYVKSICVEIHSSHENADKLEKKISSRGYKLIERTSDFGIVSSNCYFKSVR